MNIVMTHGDPVGEVFAPSQRQCAILLETVGLDRSRTPYRNAFICVRGSTDDVEAGGLVSAGLMDREPYPFRPANWLYQVTSKGLDEARALASVCRQSTSQLVGGALMNRGA